MNSAADGGETIEGDDVVDGLTNYVSVVVQADGPFGEEPLTYAQPVNTILAVGDAVLVPFGDSRDVIGYVVAVDIPCDPELVPKVKPIRSIIDGAAAFDDILWTCARWVCEQTLSGPRDVIRLIAPPLQSAQIKTYVHLSPDWKERTKAVKSSDQRAILERLSNSTNRKIELNELSRGLGAAKPSIAALRRKQAVSLTRTVEPAAVKHRSVRVLALSVSQEEAESERSRVISRRSDRQASLLTRLIQALSLNGSDRTVVVESSEAAAAKVLVERGIARFEERTVRRDPFGPRTAVSTVPPGLTDEQTVAANAVTDAMANDAKTPFLLYGVTGSGKTEVYLHAIEQARRAGRGVIFLLPEIGLTAQVMDLLQGRFGDDVAVLHSALSEGERHDEWQRIVRGEATIVVGARSAIFAPVRNLGLIVVDEEHESSFKQESIPRYHARDVARFRSRQSNAVLVLGSATPSIESYYNATHGIYRLLSLTKRVAERPLPPVIILDQRVTKQVNSREESASSQALSILSLPLQDAIAKRLKLHQQSILFINRRGFSTFLLCRDCGFTFKCPNCDVTLTYHRTLRLLQCHHCGYKIDAVDMCPQCNGYRLRPFGLGTEKVEEAVNACFPEARTIRMDRDTTERKGSHADLLRSFRKFEADILIGTQMVAKGLDFPNVTLVGVVSADTALNIPDYRASERAFQLLTQVAGRAGRGENVGEVFVQTFEPEHDSVKFAQQHDYIGFYAQEIKDRELLHYPPFGYLANLVGSDPVEAVAQAKIEHISSLLKQLVAATGQESIFEILGPSACSLGRLRNKYRHHVVVRCRKRRAMLQLLKETMSMIPAADRLAISLDIDPITML